VLQNLTKGGLGGEKIFIHDDGVSYKTFACPNS
jgi:hypothetical protein